MKRLKALLVATFVFVFSISFANEGMWLPHLLGNLNEKEMKSLGMKISAKDIYSINSGSLKDAIISFGGFCTGEIISSQGLILTNHHCGFDVIQNHSTLDNNYIRDGFWAMSKGQEIPNPGLFATFIVRIDDVSKAALNGITKSMSEQERQSLIDKNMAALRQNVKKEAYQDVFVRAFFEGNQYYLFVTETYRDVRLVGAPPSAIGNFGKDTDNWMWPRHTGDFSMFRIYAGKDNKPAEYSTANVPYKPKKVLSISLDGVSEGDFTMVFGFPGRTMEYLHSSAVEQIVTVNDPAKIAIRERALAVIDAHMRRDEQVKIQYASKYAGIQNAYKKWQGEILGIQRTKAVEKKKGYEAEFQKRVNANPAWKAAYGNLLDSLEQVNKELEPLGFSRDYYQEIMSKIDLFTLALQFNNLSNIQKNNGEKGFNDAVANYKERISNINKEYNRDVDMRLFAVLMEMFVKDQDRGMIAPKLAELNNEAGGDFTKAAEIIYNSSILDDGARLEAEFNKDPAGFMEKIRKDRGFELMTDLVASYSNNVSKKLGPLQTRLNQLQRTYMQAQMEVFREKKFYPDANSTMRVTYGKVNGYAPRDAVKYTYYTDLDGVMEKYKPGDYEFDVPAGLIELYRKKDYGRYGANGKMPVCFIASNHTTGGNSGSPALDAYGNLIGINFDRVWEGTMSDINYDPSLCRNIMVDIRYILFIVDKLAGAKHLVDEMKLVHPKRG